MIAGLFIFFQVLFAIYLLYYIVAFLSGAPFVPSTNATAASMISLARLKKGMIACDLGSGDGKLLHRIAKTNATAIGIEINPILVLYSKIRFYYSPRILVLWKSFWSISLKDADVLFIYLLPLRMERLEKKILKECKKGTVIVSNSFLFTNMIQIEKDEKNHVYVYRI